MRISKKIVSLLLIVTVLLPINLYVAFAEDEKPIPGTYPNASIYIGKDQKEALMSRMSNEEILKASKELVKFIPPERQHPYMYTTREQMLARRNTDDEDNKKLIKGIISTADAALKAPLITEKFKFADLEPSDWDSRNPKDLASYYDENNREIATLASASVMQAFAGQGMLRKFWYAYYLTGDKKYSDAVKKWMYQFSSFTVWQKRGWSFIEAKTKPITDDFDDGEWFGNSYLLPAFVEAYDAIYDELTEVDKAVFKATAFRYSEKIVQDMRVQRSWFLKNPPGGITNNQPAILICALGMAGIAFYNEIKEADNWLNTSRSYLNMLFSQLSLDGGQQEGPNYDMMIESATISYLMVLGQAGDNYFLNYPAVKNLQDKYLYLTMPDLKNQLPLAENSSKFTPFNIVMNLEKMYKNPYLKYILQKNAWKDINYLLFYDKDIEPKPLEGNLPTSAYKSGINTAVGRTDWSEQAIQVALKSGKYGAHDHLNENMLLVNAGNDQLLSDGGMDAPKGYGSEYIAYYGQALAHNVVMIDNLNQTPYTDGPLSYRPKFKQTIDGYFGGDFFKYFSGNAATATKEVSTEYSARQVVFLKPGYMLLRDSIKPSDKAPHQYSQLWHSEGKFSPSENGLKIQGKEFGAYLDVLYPRGAKINPYENYNSTTSAKKQTYYAVEQKGADALFVNLINVTKGAPQQLSAQYYDEKGNNVVLVDRKNGIKDTIVIRDIADNNDHSFAKVSAYYSDADVFAVSENNGKLTDFGVFNATEIKANDISLIACDNRFSASVSKKLADDGKLGEIDIDLGIITDSSNVKIKLDGSFSKIIINDEDKTADFKDAKNGYITLAVLQADLYKIKILYN